MAMSDILLGNLNRILRKPESTNSYFLNTAIAKRTTKYPRCRYYDHYDRPPYFLHYVIEKHIAMTKLCLQSINRKLEPSQVSLSFNMQKVDHSRQYCTQPMVLESCLASRLPNDTGGHFLRMTSYRRAYTKCIANTSTFSTDIRVGREFMFLPDIELRFCRLPKHVLSLKSGAMSKQCHLLTEKNRVILPPSKIELPRFRQSFQQATLSEAKVIRDLLAVNPFHSNRSRFLTTNRPDASEETTCHP